MAAMSMNKAIHGAVRRDLRRFIDALGSFPDGDRARAGQLHRAWTNFDEQLTRHHVGEHEVAWPALESIGVSGELIAQMDSEHEKLAAALQVAGAAMAALQRTATSDDALTARRSFEQLQAVTVEHLDHEEAQLEPIYQDRRDDPAIKAMGRKFARISPPIAGTFFAWVQDGASPAESAGIKEGVPAPVLLVISGIFGRNYRRQIAPTWR